jgi:hypothetical protein
MTVGEQVENDDLFVEQIPARNARWLNMTMVLQG